VAGKEDRERTKGEGDEGSSPLPPIPGSATVTESCLLVDRNVWLAGRSVPQSETALLQLRLRIVPVLVHYELLHSPTNSAY